MIDPLGRKIEYMRVSVTDRCNLRCVYCMPEGIKNIPMPQILTFEEIRDICSVAAGLGIRYIRLTGGEPLVRLGVEKLVWMIKNIPGIERVTLTTNGVLLKDKLPEMSEEEQLALLATDGMLVKRPILVGEDFVRTGFRQAEWETALG